MTAAIVADRYRAADLVLFNGTVHAMDQGHATASAMAVRDGRVLALDGDREMLSLVGDSCSKLVGHDRRQACPRICYTHGLVCQRMIPPTIWCS